MMHEHSISWNVTNSTRIDNKEVIISIQRQIIQKILENVQCSDFG